MRPRIFLLLSLLIIPIGVHANLEISEIMYDLKEGSDTGREWVEVWNNSSDPIDLTGWKFSEDGTNHGLTLSHGSGTLSPNSFAIIASDVTKFLADNSNFSATVFDSSFSLSNTGENIALKKPSGEEFVSVTEVAYSKDWGASGDGNSLQLVSGVWKNGAPTPGNTNVGSVLSEESLSSPSPSPSSSDSSVSADSSSSISPPPSSSRGTGAGSSVEPRITADAGPDRDAIVAADIELSGTALGLKKEPIDNARFIWNFGDGTTREGKTVLHHWNFPGRYVVILEVTSSEYSASDRVIVTVSSFDMVIQVADWDKGVLTLDNPTSRDIDLSWWTLILGGKKFSFPRNTVVLSKGKLILSSEATGFVYSKDDSIELMYPNGSRAGSYTLLTPVVFSQTAIKSSGVEISVKKSTPKLASKVEVKLPNPTSSQEAKIISAVDTTLSQKEIADTGRNKFMTKASENNEKKISLWYWIIGVGLLVALGIFATRFIKKDEADEYTIIEDKDDN